MDIMRKKRIQNAGPSDHFNFQNAPALCGKKAHSLVTCPLDTLKILCQFFTWVCQVGNYNNLKKGLLPMLVVGIA